MIRDLIASGLVGAGCWLAVADAAGWLALWLAKGRP